MNDTSANSPSDEKQPRHAPQVATGGFASITRFPDISRAAFLSLIYLTFIGLVARLYHLGIAGLWTDEATILSRALSFPEWDNFLTQPLSPNFYWYNPISGSFTEWLLTGISVSAWPTVTGFRLYIALTGTLCIPVAWLLARSLRLPSTTALVFSVVVTISPTMMVYSREGRYYVFYYFCLLLFWLALNRHYNQPTRKAATLAALAGAMSPLTTPYGFLPVCMIMVVYAVLALQDRHYSYIRRLPLLGIAFMIFALPAFAWAIRYAQYVFAGFSSKPPDYERLMHLSDLGNLRVWTALIWQAFFQADIWGEYHKVDAGPQQIAWFLAFLSCCLSCATHKNRTIRTLPLLALLNIGILVAAGSDTQGPHIRYFVGAWLPIHLIASIGFGTVLLRIGTRVRLESKLFLLASAITIGALCVWSYNAVVKDAKYAYGEVTRLVLGVQAQNDAHMVFVAGDENSGIPRHLVNTHLKLKKSKIATTELDRKNMLSSADAANALAEICRLTSATLFYSTHNPSSVWQDLETSGLAIGIQMYDERTLYATSLSLVTGMQESATFKFEILQNALDLLGDNPYSKAVISYQLWKVARRNPGLLKPEELATLEQDFVKVNPSYAAQVYQHRGDYNGVVREASKLIRQRPQYFYGYVLYAHGKQMQFEVTKDATSLKEALREFQKGVDKGVKFESWIEKWIADLKVKADQPIVD